MTTVSALQKLDEARNLCKAASKKSGEAQVDAQARALIKVANLNLTNAVEFRNLLGLDQALFSLCLSAARHPFGPHMQINNPSALVSRVISLARQGAK
jgi:hypothetical protein